MARTAGNAHGLRRQRLAIFACDCGEVRDLAADVGSAGVDMA
jgi:hypothetical protein